jgi:hypothetical protein
METPMHRGFTPAKRVRQCVHGRQPGGIEKIFIKKILLSCVVIEEIQLLRGDGKFDGAMYFRYFLKKAPTGLIGNPVEVGSGPAAVSRITHLFPVRHWP